MNFHEKISNLKIHTFPSSDVRFKYYPWGIFIYEGP
jgi:hypothetical protein